MIWDKVAKIVETLCNRGTQHGEDLSENASKMRDVMNSTHLFLIDAAPHDFLPKSYTKEQCEFFKDNFFLPFRTIAIEDKGSLIFLYDAENHQRGLTCQRLWAEFMLGDVALDGFRERDNPEAQAAYARNRTVSKNKMVITVGNISKVIPEPGKKTYVEGYVKSIAMQDTETCEILIGNAGIINQLGQESYQALADSGLRNALQAIEEVIYFNDPSNFVLEETPRSFRRRQSSGAGKNRIQRSQDRPIYTVLKPTQIRRRLRLPDPQLPGGVKRRPHERRAHLRTYSDDPQLWPQVHGKTIVVKGCWIGPSEAEVDGKIYKVLVDMRPPQIPPSVPEVVDDASDDAQPTGPKE